MRNRVKQRKREREREREEEGGRGEDRRSTKNHPVIITTMHSEVAS
jgi:hypothetical protein